MKNVLVNVIATVFIFLFSTSSLISGEWIEKTVVDKEFKVDEGARLVIDHEFGDVKCENWDQRSISVVAIVRVKSNDQQKATKIIDNVIVDVKGNSSKVETICELNQKFHKRNDSQVTIDLYIKMPKNINLELENAFGSVHIETVEGDASISSEYGYLEVASLEGNSNNIEVEFGKGEIGYLANGDIEISYSGMEIGGANSLSLESEYSDVEIGKIESLSAEVEGGHLKIGTIGALELESSFTHVEIGSLSSSLICESEYGGLEIDEVLTTFSKIEIENSFGSIKLGVNDEASYSIEAVSAYGSIDYPEQKADLSYRNQSSGELTIKGIIGNSSKVNSSMILTTDYGSIKIR